MDNSSDIIYITTHAKSIMRNLLWPNGPVCPVCGSRHYSKLKDGRYYCKECSKHYSIKKGSHAVSDCSDLYNDWLIDTGCPISQNNHSRNQYMTSDGKSSNPVEGNISQWKRQTLNNHCSLMPRLLQLYLDDFAFRFNTRKLTGRGTVESRRRIDRTTTIYDLIQRTT